MSKNEQAMKGQRVGYRLGSTGPNSAGHETERMERKVRLALFPIISRKTWLLTRGVDSAVRESMR